MDLAVLISVGVLAAALGAGIGLMLGRFVWPPNPKTDSEAVAAARVELSRRDLEMNLLRSQLNDLEASHKKAIDDAKTAGEEVARLAERVTGTSKQLEEQTRNQSALEAQRDKIAGEAQTLGAEVARLKEKEVSLLQRIEVQAAQFTDQQNKLVGELENLRTQHDQITKEAKESGAAVARLNEKEASLLQRIEEKAAQFVDQRSALAAELETLKTQHEQVTKEAKASGAEIARLKEREVASTQKIDGLKAQLADQQKTLTAEFENIANRILKTSSTELSEHSQKGLSAILDPLRERIQDFQKKVESTYEAENREVLSLKENIKTMVETTHSIGNQADGLAKALRGGAQLLGRWGEVVLERILETSGLTPGRDYVPQGKGLGLKDELGGTQKPDILIKLLKTAP